MILETAECVGWDGVSARETEFEARRRSRSRPNEITAWLALIFSNCAERHNTELGLRSFQNILYTTYTLVIHKQACLQLTIAHTHTHTHAQSCTGTSIITGCRYDHTQRRATQRDSLANTHTDRFHIYMQTTSYLQHKHVKLHL